MLRNKKYLRIKYFMLVYKIIRADYNSKFGSWQVVNNDLLDTNSVRSNYYHLLR